jgi:flagellar basal-body M-ring protein/flagellar hook-basal body protein fliF
MDQIRKLFAALTTSQRISIAGVAAVVIALLMAFAHWRKESDFKPLYTALAPEDAAGVIAKLKESGTEYRVSDNGTSVLAPSARVAELRLELAAAGVPKTGRIGYELFDKTNFGATEFTEHLNYHRALEGEIERSIGTLSSVEAARVHLTFPKDSVFLDSRQPAKGQRDFESAHGFGTDGAKRGRDHEPRGQRGRGAVSGSGFRSRCAGNAAQPAASRSERGPIGGSDAGVQAEDRE